MAIDLFGFSIGKKSKEEEIETSLKQEAFVSPDEYDGAQTINSGGFMGTYVDFSGGIQNENQFIHTYRNIALYPEVDMAIEDIINDSIIMGQDRKPVKLNLANTGFAVDTSLYNVVIMDYTLESTNGVRAGQLRFGTDTSASTVMIDDNYTETSTVDIVFNADISITNTLKLQYTDNDNANATFKYTYQLWNSN